MAQLGIIPGETFNWNNLSRKLQNAIKPVPKLAFHKIISFESKSGRNQNGWIFPKIPNHYGTNYLLRAFIAAYGWPGNLPDDAIYLYTNVDSNGKKLSGRYNYTLRFPKDQTPPIKAFWSITMYDPEYFFTPNALNKFTLSPRDPLIYNTKDGSLDLYFQHVAPEESKQSNWLPSPQGNFVLMLRMYWPQIQNSSWTVPPVKKV
ncbi:unnamed protein product [Adineta ricciae]|uniref:DUF1214 domain-containing protein n=1 Tax=Adineta ricciae TaxID=249248 RepID=A0A815PWS1_ADIRI|nr:unnamed protein product [Adineta ricciae]CAF1454513.1 unnamed protein product [Adineta ricciae]